jgi:ferredoxin
MTSLHKVSFSDSEMQPVELENNSCLSEHLTIQNSPILFGCRIGICGTCLVEVLDEHPENRIRTEVEEEYLSAIAPEQKNARLACQIHLKRDLLIKKIEI